MLNPSPRFRLCLLCGSPLRESIPDDFCGGCAQSKNPRLASIRQKLQSAHKLMSAACNELEEAMYAPGETADDFEASRFPICRNLNAVESFLRTSIENFEDFQEEHAE